MNSLGISSYYSTYADSVYKSNEVSYVSNKQESADAEIPSNNASASDDINDEAIISDKAKSLLAMDGTQKETTDKTEQKTQNNDKIENNGSKLKKELSPEQEQEIAELKARDAEVRAHEQAHIAASGGTTTSAPSFDYQKGPDGEKYAIGGEVSISFVQGNDPAVNLANAEAMKASALAPVDPSGQDLAVARSADKMIEEAKKELAEQKEEKADSTNDKSDKTNDKNSAEEQADSTTETDKQPSVTSID